MPKPTSQTRHSPARLPLTNQARRAFSLVDLLIAISIIAIAITAALPTAGADAPVKLLSAATMLISDVEYAQSATLADPSDATIIFFDTENDAYWLALNSEPLTPIPTPGSGDPYLVQYGVGNHETLSGITITLTDVTNSRLVFDPFGSLTQLNNPTLTLNNTSGDINIAVTASTGSVALAP